MARAGSKRTWSVNLFLEEKEAIYLKQLLQNPLNEKESTENREIRESIWTALDSGDLFNLH